MSNRVLFLLVTFFLNSPIFAQQVTDHYAPESEHVSRSGPLLKADTSSFAQEFIVVTAHPEASEVGFDVLLRGGNAIDAMVAVQTMLGLVEPQSSGLGGGAFLLYYDAKRKRLSTFDGRETAPRAAPNDLFLDPDKKPMPFFDAVVGGRSVGTPGTIKLLSEVHRRYGSQSWKGLLAPAIEKARAGFTVTERLANAVANDEQYLARDPEARDYFLPAGRPVLVGHELKNPAYAATLDRLAKNGAEAFYQGDIAQAISQKVQNHSNRGYLSVQDFLDYEMVERPALCAFYRHYEVCGMGPPSSGAMAVGQILGTLAPFTLHQREPKSAQSWQLVAEASRLAFADRGMYIADPAYVPIPDGLLDSDYLTSRAALIKPGQASGKVLPGRPEQAPQVRVTGVSPEQPSTTHFVIVDGQGNIVSMTSTVENGFGSRLMVKGFLLNNELTDFSFRVRGEPGLIANRVEGGKRPRSSMAPTIVFTRGDNDQRQPVLALGSPGGSRIINYVANSLLRVLDWGYSLQEAFDQPHIVNRFGTMDLEQGTQAEGLEREFNKMGYQTSIRSLNSGLHGIRFHKNGMEGAADYRREGVVRGR